MKLLTIWFKTLKNKNKKLLHLIPYPYCVLPFLQCGMDWKSRVRWRSFRWRWLTVYEITVPTIVRPRRSPTSSPESWAKQQSLGHWVVKVFRGCTITKWKTSSVLLQSSRTCICLISFLSKHMVVVDNGISDYLLDSNYVRSMKRSEEK